MPSTFEFYRPRGVPRNYVVEISLDPYTSETEPPLTFTVSVAHNRTYNCGYCGTQSPSHTHTTTTVEQGKKAGVVETYEIGSGKHPEPMIIGDKITIEVRDNRIVPVQRLVYTATEHGFTCTQQPYTINGQTWQPKEIEFQKIAVVDCGDQKRTLPEHTYEHNHAASVFGPETVMTPVPQPAPERKPVVSFSPKHINLQAHLNDIEGYLKQYPYLSQVQIIHAMTQFSSPEGTFDIPKLTKSLRKSNEKMRKKAEEAMPGEPLPVQQARQIIESHSF